MGSAVCRPYRSDERTDHCFAVTVAATPRAQLSVPEKIALFRSLFRGREDVYAIQWARPDGNVSYAPACLRDWKALRSVPEAERRKMDKATRQLVPLIYRRKPH